MVVETRRKSYHQHSIINTVTQEMMIAPRRRLLNQPLTAMRVKVEAVSSSTLLTNFITNVTTALILLHHQNVSLTTTITDRARGGHVPLTIGAGLYLPVDQFTFPMYKLAAHMMNGIKVVSPGAESNGEGVKLVTRLVEVKFDLELLNAPDLKPNLCARSDPLRLPVGGCSFAFLLFYNDLLILQITLHTKIK